MKLQAEYDYTKTKFNMIDHDVVIKHARYVKDSGDYKDFETRISWDVGRAAVGTKKICEWYDKYDCNDNHIGTLFKKVMHEVFPDALAV